VEEGKDMSIQIGTDPETGEPVYAPVNPATIPGFDASGHAIPNYKPPKGATTSTVEQSNTLNTVISEEPISYQAQEYLAQLVKKNPITPEMVREAKQKFPVK
jgi:hypothetical protein